jgi:hypothetical protein
MQAQQGCCEGHPAAIISPSAYCVKQYNQLENRICPRRLRPADKSFGWPPRTALYTTVGNNTDVQCAGRRGLLMGTDMRLISPCSKARRSVMTTTHESSAENPIPPQDLSGIVGRRFIYTYANGRQYEMYVQTPPPSTTERHHLCRSGRPPARLRRPHQLTERTAAPVGSMRQRAGRPAPARSRSARGSGARTRRADRGRRRVRPRRRSPRRSRRPGRCPARDRETRCPARPPRDRRTPRR